MAGHCSMRTWRRQKKVLFAVVCIGIVIYITGEIRSYIQPYKNKSMVLVVAYMRSGSSLVGEILQQHYSTFYVFEPLRPVTELTEANQTVTFLNGTTRKISSRTELSEVHADILHSWFTCNFSRLDMGSLTNDFLMYYGLRSRPYHTCLKQQQHGTSRDAVVSCLHLLQEICVPSELRAIKVVRLDLSSVSMLLKSLPTLRVVHLFRDPRAMMHSLVRVKLSVWDDIERQAKFCCSKMLADIQVSKSIMSEYKNRFKILIYENFAENPIEKSKQLYKLANITMHKYTENYIHYLTNTSRPFQCEWCVKRSNSISTSRQWRKYLHEKHMKVIDKHCTAVYQELGYKLFSSTKELRNLNIPSFEGTGFTDDALYITASNIKYS